MKLRARNLSRPWPAALAAVAVLAMSPPLPAQNLAGGNASTPVSPAFRSRTPVTVNFVNADIEAVTRAMGAMIQRQIAVDPRVKGTITVYSEQPLTVREAYLNYLAALRGMGFTMVEVGGLLKLVPEADAKLQTGSVVVGEATARGDQVLTQVFTLRHENPNNLVAVLRPLISANNTINASPGNNSLVITDYADNLQRIAKIIAALDQPAATDLEIVPLRHAVASDIVGLVQRLAESSGAPGTPGLPGAGGGGATSVVADVRSNSLIVRAPNPARMASIKGIIEKLDHANNRAGGGPGGNIWVVHLKNADATKLASVLRAAFSAGAGGGVGASTPAPAAQTITAAGGATAATAPVQASPGPSTGGFVQADPSTNSLIITAAEPLFRQIRSMIEQLDSRRAQVYIESLIVEVSGGNDAEFGFQWQGLLGRKGDNYGVAAGTNFAVGSQPNIISLTGALAGTGTVVPGTGLNIGLIKDFGGAYNLAAIARLLQTQSNTNIVSTPNLITLDNEEAKIVVGENVPFITGQFTQTGTAATNPFQTIERKDVGITLRIKPQIGEGGTVRLQIFQEQSSVKLTPVAGTSNAGPSTTKRSIESTVVVDDGSILVLGGLIEDRYDTTSSKVPLLGDLPFIGALFRSESRERKRSNMLVFLRPVVMRSAEDATRLSMDRYDVIRAQQKDSQPLPSGVMPVNEAPVLPPLRVPAPAVVPASAPASR